VFFSEHSVVRFSFLTPSMSKAFQKTILHMFRPCGVLHRVLTFTQGKTVQNCPEVLSTIPDRNCIAALRSEI